MFKIKNLQKNNLNVLSNYYFKYIYYIIFIISGVAILTPLNSKGFTSAELKRIESDFSRKSCVDESNLDNFKKLIDSRLDNLVCATHDLDTCKIITGAQGASAAIAAAYANITNSRSLLKPDTFICGAGGASVNDQRNSYFAKLYFNLLLNQVYAASVSTLSCNLNHQDRNRLIRLAEQAKAEAEKRTKVPLTKREIELRAELNAQEAELQKLNSQIESEYNKALERLKNQKSFTDAAKFTNLTWENPSHAAETLLKHFNGDSALDPSISKHLGARSLESESIKEALIYYSQNSSTTAEKIAAGEYIRGLFDLDSINRENFEAKSNYRTQASQKLNDSKTKLVNQSESRIADLKSQIAELSKTSEHAKSVQQIEAILSELRKSPTIRPAEYGRYLAQIYKVMPDKVGDLLFKTQGLSKPSIDVRRFSPATEVSASGATEEIKTSRNLTNKAIPVQGNLTNTAAQEAAKKHIASKAAGFITPEFMFGTLLTGVGLAVVSGEVHAGTIKDDFIRYDGEKLTGLTELFYTLPWESQVELAEQNRDICSALLNEAREKDSTNWKATCVQNESGKYSKLMLENPLTSQVVRYDLDDQGEILDIYFKSKPGELSFKMDSSGSFYTLNNRSFISTGNVGYGNPNAGQGRNDVNPKVDLKKLTWEKPKTEFADDFNFKAKAMKNDINQSFAEANACCQNIMSVERCSQYGLSSTSGRSRLDKSDSAYQ